MSIQEDRASHILQTYTLWVDKLNRGIGRCHTNRLHTYCAIVCDTMHTGARLMHNMKRFPKYCIAAHSVALDITITHSPQSQSESTPNWCHRQTHKPKIYRWLLMNKFTCRQNKFRMAWPTIENFAAWGRCIHAIFAIDHNTRIQWHIEY